MSYSIKNKKGVLTTAIIAAALSMTMLTATTIISYNGVQQAFATPTSWCYSVGDGAFHCFGNKGDCQKQQQADLTANSGCFKKILP